ncbi:MAG: hypothetical protein DRP47_03685 [Candidatus Zixiibacteriota bacterium]|nr:MAG: hypothetical protein DRP47_03685 [candidate division Zixibacteria bacterium]
MYNIEKKDYGYKLTFAGKVDKDEMARWLEEIEHILSKQPGSFTVLMDIQNLQPVSQIAQKFFRRGQMLLEKRGLTRSAVVLSGSTLAMQFKRLAVQSGIFDKERYVDIVNNPQWEEVSLGWLTESIEPDAFIQKI